MTVAEIIQAAYAIQPFQLVRIDRPVLGQRVDIVAKAPAPASPAEMQRMLQPLLAERFGLIVHRETRDMDALTLTVEANDGRLGPNMRRTGSDCDELATGANRFVLGRAPATEEQAACGLLPAEGPGRIRAKGLAMKSFASLLAPSQRRPVVDQTGLEGRYDIDLTYTPDAFARAPLAQRGGTAPPQVDPDGPSLMTALREQLGLRLQSKRMPIEVVVMDQIQPPSEN